MPTSCSHPHHHHPELPSSPEPPAGSAEGMAKDPICGMVVPKATAL